MLYKIGHLKLYKIILIYSNNLHFENFEIFVLPTLSINLIYPLSKRTRIQYIKFEDQLNPLLVFTYTNNRKH